MAYGIDNIVQQKADAYRSNPNALMQSYEQKKELIDLLALQKIKSEQEAYARDMQAQMQEVPGTIAQQLEQEVVGTERERITQQIMPGMQQQAQMQPNQMQQAMPGMQQGGLPTQPAPNMARMMQGGIVGYAAGGMLPKAQMPTPEAQQAAPVTPEQVAAFRARLKELNEAKANAFPQEKDIFQQQIQNLLNTTPIAIRNAAGAGMARGGVVGYAPGGAVNMDALLDALMMAESGGDPTEVSSAGAEGAYQIMPSTAADPGFGVPPMEGDRFDPEASRAFARQYLQAMIDRYDGDVEAGLIAYNAGARNADRFIAAGRDYEVLPQTMQTQPYVNRIMNQVGVSGPSPQNIPEGAGQGVQENNRAANYIAMMQQNEDMLANIATPMPQEVVMEDAVVEDVVVAPKNGIEGYLMNIGRQQQQRRDDFREAVPSAEAAVARAEQEKADGGIGYLRRVGRLQEGAAQRQAEESNRAAKFMAMLQQNRGAIAGMDPAEKGTGQAYTQQTLPFQEFQNGGGVKRFNGEKDSYILAEGASYGPDGEEIDVEMTDVENAMADAGLTGSGLGALGKIPASIYNHFVNDEPTTAMAKRRMEEQAVTSALKKQYPDASYGQIRALATVGMNDAREEVDEANVPATDANYPLTPLTPKQEQENIVKGLLALPRKSALQKRKEAYEEEFGGSERNGIARLSDFLMGVGQSGGTNLGAALTGGGTALRSGDQAERSRRQEVSKELLGMEELQAARSADLQQIFAESALASQLAAASDRSEFIADAMEEIRSSDPAYGLLEADLLEKLQDGEITQLEYDAGVEFALTSALSRLDSVYSGSVSGTATTPFNAATTGSFDQ